MPEAFPKPDTRRRHAAVLIAAFTGACGLFGTSSDETAPEEPEPRPRTTVLVENRYGLDVNIHVLRGGAPIRLGRVTTHSRVIFDLSSVVTGTGHDLRFVADPIGADAYTTEPVSVRPGDAVQFRVAQSLEQSSVSVQLGAYIGTPPDA